jgi:hypothetical protein
VNRHITSLGAVSVIMDAIVPDIDDDFIEIDAVPDIHDDFIDIDGF